MTHGFEGLRAAASAREGWHMRRHLPKRGPMVCVDRFCGLHSFGQRHSRPETTVASESARAEIVSPQSAHPCAGPRWELMGGEDVDCGYQLTVALGELMTLPKPSIAHGPCRMGADGIFDRIIWRDVSRSFKSTARITPHCAIIGRPNKKLPLLPSPDGFARKKAESPGEDSHSPPGSCPRGRWKVKGAHSIEGLCPSAQGSRECHGMPPG
jgi:hypothetical protein